MANEGVAAVERALSILEAFGEDETELALPELAVRTGMYKSTILRLARSLEKFGYLARTDRGEYRLGSKLFHMGSIYQRHFRTASIVPPVLRDLALELNEGASFHVRDGEQSVCQHRVDAARSVRDSVREGDRLPLDAGAAAHVIRAFEGAPGKRYDTIRHDLHASSFGEGDAEVSAIACPVFGAGQRFVGALTVSAPRYRMGPERVRPVVRALLGQAARLTAAFGGDPAIYRPRLRAKRTTRVPPA
jgi:DNA-binding IclR family transcriptional regulator